MLTRGDTVTAADADADDDAAAAITSLEPLVRRRDRAHYIVSNFKFVWGAMHACKTRQCTRRDEAMRCECEATNKFFIVVVIPKCTNWLIYYF
jgi:hypothetical protein